MSIYADTSVAQFENVNELRNYPFTDSSSLVDSLGRSLPADVIVDAHFFVPADVELGVPSESPVVRLSSVHMSQAMLSACFIADFKGTVNALSVTVSKDDFKPYFPYRLEKLIGSRDIGGIVSFGFVPFPGFPETYVLRSAEIHPCCVAACKPAGLRRIEDPRSGEHVCGDVKIEFSGYVESEKFENGYLLTVDDASALQLASKCVDSDRSESGVCGATPIKSINGIRPDEEGNIVLWFH